MKIHWEYVLTGVIVVAIIIAVKPYYEKALHSTGHWEQSFD